MTSFTLFLSLFSRPVVVGGAGKADVCDECSVSKCYSRLVDETELADVTVRQVLWKHGGDGDAWRHCAGTNRGKITRLHVSQRSSISRIINSTHTGADCYRAAHAHARAHTCASAPPLTGDGSISLMVILAAPLVTHDVRKAKRRNDRANILDSNKRLKDGLMLTGGTLTSNHLISMNVKQSNVTSRTHTQQQFTSWHHEGHRWAPREDPTPFSARDPNSPNV